jgi:hypothetical protein
MTKLDSPLRREVEIDGRLYKLTLDFAGLKLAKKGRRKGLEVTWQALVMGDAALAAGLQASMAAN